MFSLLSCVWPRGLQQTRLPCPSPSRPVCSDSCQLSQWCHPAISPSVAATPPFLLPSVFPSIRIFSLSWFFISNGHSIGVSALASVLPMNIQGWFPLGLNCLVSWVSKGFSRVLSSTAIWKYYINFFICIYYISICLFCILFISSNSSLLLLLAVKFLEFSICKIMSSALWMQTQGIETRAVTSMAYLELSSCIHVRIPN